MVCWFSLIKLQLPLMPKILTTVLLLFIQTQVFIRIDFCTKSNAMMLEFSLLPFSNVLVHVLTSMQRAIWFKIGFWTQMISHDVLWCSPGFCFDPLWTATFVGHFWVVQKSPVCKMPFKTILPVSHLQPCVLALPQVKSPLILMPMCSFYRGTNINRIVP
jgi:hypothetical protein